MASSHLMSEEDVREYFLQNNGIVRNTDIVNYFRPYLSDPNIRDEARVLFKSYVNKLANVKTENGEKFLVLKRQYFHPIDGNGNGRPVSGISNSYSQQLPPYNSPPYSSPPNPYNNAYPPPVRNDPVQLQQQHSLSRPTLQRTLSQQSYSMSQSQLYGSAFSLSSVSNYGDPYYGNSLASNNNTYSNAIPTYPSNVNVPPAYPPPPVSYPAQQQAGLLPDYNNDYGLPPVPSNPMAPPRRYPTSPPSLTSSLSSTSLNMINPVRMPPPYRPPPYRPPPPGPRYPSSTPQQQQVAAPIMRNPINFPPRFPHPPSVQMSQNNNYHSEPPTPTTPALPHHQYQRSLSVPGALIPGQEGSSPGYSENSSNNNNSAFPTPPPPVPPRSKRGGFGGPVRTPGGMAMSDADDDGGFETLRSERSNSMGAEAASSVSKIPIVELRRSNSEGASIDDSALTTANDIDNKENVDLANGNTSGASGSSSIDNGEEGGGILNGNCVNGNVNSDVEQKISVKERLQKFNRIASESELAATSPPKMPSAARSRRENPNKHDSVDFDTASLSSFGFSFAHMQPKDKEWILKAANSDYHALNKMAQENSSLVKRRDMNTALHWAAKHGNAELVKLLAGTHKSDINCKSNGGYTPLHLAAQFSRQEVYDILVQVYNADVNVRDHSGKKPMQYLVRQDTTVSMDTFKKLKDKRRSHEQRESFLRIGSLNVRVKKTTEAFGNFLGKSNSSASIERILHKSWGSADNLPEAEVMEKDKQMMPPPSGNGVRRVTSKVHGKRRARKSAPASDSPTIKESVSDSDSDTACGFGYEWQNGS